MAFSKQVWDQLKAKTCDDLVTAILKDGFEQEDTKGTIHGGDWVVDTP